MVVADYSMSYDASTNIMTVWGNDTDANYELWGYDSTHAWDFSHIKAYAQYLDLDIVRDDGYEFDFNIKFVLVPGSGNKTYFKDMNKQIKFNRVGSTTADYTIYAYSGTYVYFGEETDSTLKTSRYGCDIVIDGTALTYYSGIKLAGYGGIYSSTIKILTASSTACCVFGLSGNIRVWNCTFVGGGIRDCVVATDFYNLTIDGAGLALYYAFGTFDKLEFYNCSKVAQVRRVAQAIIAKNVIAKNCDYFINFYGNSPALGYIDLTDSDIEDWESFAGSMLVGETNYAYERYTFKTRAKDSNGNLLVGASIILKNVDGTTVVSETTDSNGEISDVVLSNMWTYTRPVSAIVQVKKDYSPFTLYITKDGYETYSGEVNVDSKTTLSVTLKESKKTKVTVGGNLLLATSPEEGSSSNLLEL